MTDMSASKAAAAARAMILPLALARGTRLLRQRDFGLLPRTTRGRVLGPAQVPVVKQLAAAAD
jgi:hypothetical protein